MASGPVSRRSMLESSAIAGLAAMLPGCVGARPSVSSAVGLAPDERRIADVMERAGRYMVDQVSREGGYVWQSLPDRSREWGELEAFPTSVWVQAPGTPMMGQLFLDAYRATGNEFFYEAAAKAANVLVRGQHPSGGWNYMFDLAGEASLRKWYDTIGKNGWRLEEFQHYYGNATFDDSSTADAARFILRMYLEKRDARYRAPLEKAVQFVLDSQYAVGGWPQRFPLMADFHHHGLPDYTPFITFNDDVAAENIKFLLMVWQTLGDERVLDSISRGMDCFVRAQQPSPQAGWGLQHTVADLTPASARTYEPKALVSHTTADNCGLMMDFFELTGDPKFLARLPEAFAWLDSIRLPDPVVPSRPYPTFVEIGSNRPMFIHRRGSNVVNGEYFHNSDPLRTVAHYSSFRALDLGALRSRHARLAATPPEVASRTSPLRSGRKPLPKYFTLGPVGFRELSADARQDVGKPDPAKAEQIIAMLQDRDFWLSPLRMTSHPYIGDGSPVPAPGDYATTHVGDATDTSPYPDPSPDLGISTQTFVDNMAILIRVLAA